VDPFGVGIAPPVSFTEIFVRENRLDEYGFKEWIFHPGMLFQSLEKWWGKGGSRPAPHEGLDLCCYRDGRDRTRRLDESARIPVLYDGRVVRIIRDFLGESLMVEHPRFERKDARFVTIYGHVNPLGAIRTGVGVKEGEIVAVLADGSRSRSGVGPHLHVTLGWFSKNVPLERLDWSRIAAPGTSRLLDPLPFVS